MKPCTKVSEDVRLECKIGIERNKNKKRNELLQEIGVGPNESVFSKTMGTLWSGSGNGNESGSGSVNRSGEHIPKGPMDKFII